MSNMPNVQLFDMEDVLHSNRIGCIGPDTRPERVCCQALQAAVSRHCIHEARLQGVCRPVCFKGPAAPALRSRLFMKLLLPSEKPACSCPLNDSSWTQ